MNWKGCGGSDRGLIWSNNLRDETKEKHKVPQLGLSVSQSLYSLSYIGSRILHVICRYGHFEYMKALKNVSRRKNCVCLYVCMYVSMYVVCLRYMEQVQKYWLRKVNGCDPVWFLHTTVVPILFDIVVTLLKMDAYLTEIIPIRFIDSYCVCRYFSNEKGEYFDSLHATYLVPRSVSYSLNHKVIMQQVSLNTVSKIFANMARK
jgi:hypothetical protein